jgi:hypothetical protein
MQSARARSQSAEREKKQAEIAQHGVTSCNHALLKDLGLACRADNVDLHSQMYGTRSRPSRKGTQAAGNSG